MTLPDDFQYHAGVFAFIKAKWLAQELEPICGSPIEVLFACALFTTVEGMHGEIQVLKPTQNIPDQAEFFLKPQTQIGAHRVDFLLGGKGLNALVVECDGREFHHANRQQIDRDRQRDRDINELGYRVLRYPGTQITNETWYVAADALAELSKPFVVGFMNRYPRMIP